MNEFNAATTGYDPRNALWLGKVAALAYKDITSVVQALPGWDVTPFAHEATDTWGFVAGNSQLIVISFRGAEPDKLKAWLTNLKAELVDGPVGKVHKGFHEAIDGVWQEFVTILRRMRQNGQNIWITGHGLGAALALLASVKLLNEKVTTSIEGLYTFGQPRTGDTDFAAWLDSGMKSRTFRFVNNNDIVPHVPLPPLYKHAGTFFYFDSDGKLQGDVGFWRFLKERLKGKVKSLFDKEIVPDEIYDHSMKSYLTRLENNVGVTTAPLPLSD